MPALVTYSLDSAFTPSDGFYLGTPTNTKKAHLSWQPICIRRCTQMTYQSTQMSNRNVLRIKPNQF